MKNIQKFVETEFLRRSTPEEINDMFRQLKDKIDELEQENAKLKDALETIIYEAGCCTGEDALNMLRTAEHAIKSITGE